METDTTIEEIHELRREVSDRFDGDVFAIAEDAARRQLESNRPLWCPKATNKPLPPSIDTGVSPTDTSSPAVG